MSERPVRFLAVSSSRRNLFHILEGSRITDTHRKLAVRVQRCRSSKCEEWVADGDKHHAIGSHEPAQVLDNSLVFWSIRQRTENQRTDNHIEAGAINWQRMRKLQVG